MSIDELKKMVKKQTPPPTSKDLEALAKEIHRLYWVAHGYDMPEEIRFALEDSSHYMHIAAKALKDSEGEPIR